MISDIKKLLMRQPGLMAKDLAKTLNCTKKEINQVLYQNSDQFEVDSEYRWRLATSDGVTIQLHDGWVDCASFEASLATANLDVDSADSVTFFVPGECKVLLEALARFLALCNQLISDETKVTVDFSSSNNKSLHYLNRIGFFDHLNEDVEVLPQRPVNSTAVSHRGNNNALVEMGAVDPNEENTELINRLHKTFVDLSGDTYDVAAYTVFAELIGNIKEHSKSGLHGFAGLQKYGGKRPHIQTVISDSGLGIASTLRPSLKAHYPRLHKLYEAVDLQSDMELVKAVMSNGEISRHGAGRGLGFKSSKEQALKFNANYSVRQENFSLFFHFEDGALRHVKEQIHDVKILGTHICFDFYID